jgi:hypothetical protein
MTDFNVKENENMHLEAVIGVPGELYRLPALDCFN